MRYEDIASAALQRLSVHRETVFSSAVEHIGACKFTSPEMELSAPTGYILKSADSLPVITKSMSAQDMETFDAMIEDVAASAKQLAQADIERLTEIFKSAVKLPSIDQTRKAIEAGAVQGINHVPKWGEK